MFLEETKDRTSLHPYWEVMILISFLSFLAIAASQSQPNNPSLYVRLGSVFESICLSQVERTDLVSRQASPGKMGPVGAKGEPGIKASKGDLEEADYDKMEEMISKRIQEVLDIQARKYANLSNMLLEANEEIRQLKNDTNLIGQWVKNGTDYCLMKYIEKCFWIEYRGRRKISFQQGQALCNAQGGMPANIYSEDHFYMMMGYLGTFSRKLGYVHAWLGMTYNSETKTALLSDGTRAPFMKWHPGHPTGCCNMGLKAYGDGQRKNQFFWVNPSSYPFEGVICEK